MNYFYASGASTGLTKIGPVGYWGGYETHWYGVYPDNYVYMSLPATIGNTYNVSFGWTYWSGDSTNLVIRLTDAHGVTIDSHTFSEFTPVGEWAAANGYTTQTYTDPASGLITLVDFFKNIVAETVAINVLVYKTDVGTTLAVFNYLLYSSPQVIPRPATINSAIIGPTNKTLVLKIGNLSEGPSDLVSITTNPTITVNGGSPVQLTNPIWSDGAYDVALSYIVYPFASPLAPTDVVTVTAVDSWATCLAGLLGPVTNLAATHAVGTLLPKFPADRKTMKVGFNINYPYSGLNMMVYANLARQISTWSGDVTIRSDGIPSSINSGKIASCALTGPGGSPDGNGAYYVAPNGTYTVQWHSNTKDYVVFLATNSGDTVSAATITTLGDGRTRLQQTVTPNRPGSPNLILIIMHPASMSDPLNNVGAAESFNVDISQFEVYPPGIDPDNPPKYHPNVVEVASKAKSIRFMDAMSTNSSSVVNYSDWPEADPSVRISGQDFLIVSGTIVEIGPYLNEDNFYLFPNPNGTPIKVTFSAPHPFNEGMQGNMSGVAGPNGDGTFPLAGGTYKVGGGHTGEPIPPGTLIPSLNGMGVQAHVVSATEIAYIGPGVGWGAEQILGGPFTTGLGTNPIVWAFRKQGWPPVDCIDFCNVTRTDPWINFPHAGTDQCAIDLFDMIAANLAPGLKCYLEYSNETWNTFGAFTQSGYCDSNGNLTGRAPWSGLAMTIAIDGNGRVVPTITNGGTDFHSGLGIPITFTGGTLISGTAARGWLISHLGSVTGVYFQNHGHYSSAPTGFTLVGTGLEMTWVLDSNGYVVPTITNGGVGFWAGANITFTGGTLISGVADVGAVQDPTGVVSSITMGFLGAYSSPPTGFTITPKAMGLDTWYVWRACQIFTIARDRFILANRDQTDLVRILGGQGGYTGRNGPRVGAAVSFGYQFEGFASAPYFWNGPNDPRLGAIYDSIDIDQCMDLAELYIEVSTTPAEANQPILDQLLPTARMCCYEGGTEVGALTSAYSDSTHVAAQGARSRAWGRHPRMRGILHRYFQRIQNAGNFLFEYYMMLADVRGVRYDHDAMWGAYNNWNEKPGTGDGSDGQFDNRTNYEDLANIVSVVGGAIDRWNFLTKPKVHVRRGRGRQLARRA